MRGTPAAIGASCRLPAALAASRPTLHSRAAALRLLRRAGFAHARYAGLQHGVDARSQGRYGLFELRDSDYLPCAGRIAVRRGAD